MDKIKEIKYKLYKNFGKVLDATIGHKYSDGDEICDRKLEFGECNNYYGDFSESIYNMGYHSYEMSRDFKKPEVKLVENVIAGGYYPILFTSEKKILIESMVDADIFCLNVIALFFHPIEVIKNQTNIDRIDGTYFILYNQRSNNYYHWHVENIIKLRGALKYQKENDENVQLVVSPELSKWQRDSLKLLGFSGDDLYYWNKSNVKFSKILTVPNLRNRPGCVKWLRDAMSVGIKNHSKNIYISRKDATSRSVVNRNEIEEILTKYDFEIVVPGKYDLSTQISKLSQAKTVVGPHGAGLTNILHCKPGIHLLEVFPEDDVREQYYRLADMLEHDYSYMLCPSEGSDIFVDPYMFEEMLEKILSQ